METIGLLQHRLQVYRKLMEFMSASLHIDDDCFCMMHSVILQFVCNFTEFGNKFSGDFTKFQMADGIIKSLQACVVDMQVLTKSWETTVQ